MIKFFESTFGQIFIATLIVITGVLLIVAITTFSQVNKGFDQFVERQEEFFQGRGLLAKFEAVDNVKEYEKITEDFKSKVLTSIIFSSTVGVVVGVFTSLIISDRITKPLSKLKNIVKNVSKNNYDERAVLEGSSEIRELISEFNSLIDELDRIESLRENLVTDVAHELKTPLTKIRGQVEGVLDGVYKCNEDNLRTILKNIEQLEYLIERLQDMVQLKSGEEHLKKEKINLKELLQDVIGGFSGKPITIVLDINSDLTIEADEKKFREVLDNLISNAYKYTKKGNITITVDDKSLKISDTGIGISEKDLPYIFERFYRVDKSRNKKTGGLGLGLSIVKEIVEAHGWSIEVESKEGEGSIFRILFPSQK